MEKFDIFTDITERTAGSVYIGVVGPVRTGKSTFIKRFMDLLVLPNIKDPHIKERTQDELPQGGAGRQVMTTQRILSLMIRYSLICKRALRLRCV